MNNLTEKINQIYNQKGLNSVYSFLKREKINFEKIVHEFGLNTNKKAYQAKKDFINNDQLKFHYYSILIRNKKGYYFNLLRALEIKIK